MTSSEFIQQNKEKSLIELSLLLSKKPELDKKFILSQINGIQKAKNKLPQFYNTPNIIYPSKIALEQCSSEKTGIYKSKLIKGNSLIDLTGGFGIDSFYFAKKFKNVSYVEQNQALFELTQNNFGLLNANNIKMVNTSAEKFILDTQQKADIVYIDPSRRNKSKRVFRLDECTPNIIELAPFIFKITDKILIKTAPLLDIKQTLKDLKYVTKVWVIAVDNDCKEVLYLVEKNVIAEPKIYAINLNRSNQKFSFNFKQESNVNVAYSLPINYLYEPNVSILKAGGFNSICKQFKLNKIAKNTHLYTSEELVEDFPGRTFKINHALPYQTKSFKKLALKKANVSCRNFKDSVAQIKKKLKLKDGGKDYLFATTDINNKAILLVCNKT